MEKRRYYQIFEHEKQHWWYQGRRRLLIDLVSSLRKQQAAKILDIGCGTGYILETLKPFGVVYGVDVSPAAIAFCQKRGLKNVFLNQKEKLPFPSNYFQLITCFDVLEHVKDDHQVLKEIHRVIAVHGHLIIFVPACPLLWGKLDEISHHYRRYTRGDLKSKLSENGFAVQKIAYFNSFLFLPILGIRLFQKTFFGKKNLWGIPVGISSFWFNRFLKLLFTFDIKIATVFPWPFGVSVMAIATVHTKAER